MKLVFDLDADRCSACGACAVACMDQNNADPVTRGTQLRIAGSAEDKEKQAYMSVSCFHCDDAPCIMACPSGCLYKDEETGFTLFDSANCIGCRSCALACPFGAPVFGADGKMHKCDGCITRVRCGLKPACVRNCPTLALRIMGESEFDKQLKGRSLRKLSQHILDY